jgi:hypothetical protein
VIAGGRLVIAFSPAESAPSWEVKSLLDRLAADVSSSSSQGHVARKARLAEGIAGLRSVEFTWHGQCWFTGVAAPWRTIASCNGKPALIERSWGKGSIVVSADSYFLSNEGLWRERQPELLSWLAAGRRIIFDETHLGVTESTGVADLARRLGLEGLAACLVLAALLFVWKSAVPFLPRDAELAERMSGEAVEGRTSASGLLGLLRKSIPAKQLLSTCVNEWARSCPANSSAARKVPAVQQMALDEESRPARQRNLASAYRSICRILTERKTRNGAHD